MLDANTTCTATIEGHRCTLHREHRGTHFDSLEDVSFEAPDLDRFTDITEDGVSIHAWAHSDYPGVWIWSAWKFRPIALTQLYVEGVGNVGGHAEGRDDAIRLARKYARLVGAGL